MTHRDHTVLQIIEGRDTGLRMVIDGSLYYIHVIESSDMGHTRMKPDITRMNIGI